MERVQAQVEMIHFSSPAAALADSAMVCKRLQLADEGIHFQHTSNLFYEMTRYVLISLYVCTLTGALYRHCKCYQMRWSSTILIQLGFLYHDIALPLTLMWLHMND